VRDWLHVTDHCRGLELILQCGTPGEAYNIGGTCECANIDLIRMLCAAFDTLFASDATLKKRYPNSPPAIGARSESLIHFVADRPGHDRRYAVDCAKMQRTFGFAPCIPLEQGLAAVVDLYTARRRVGEETSRKRERGHRHA
jgi:dTDP-glucose 4,6-dehydratase